MKKRKILVASILLSLITVAINVIRLYVKKDDFEIDINSNDEVHSI